MLLSSSPLEESWGTFSMALATACVADFVWWWQQRCSCCSWLSGHCHAL